MVNNIIYVCITLSQATMTKYNVSRNRQFFLYLCLFPSVVLNLGLSKSAWNTDDIYN